ncbi:MAG TPA: hypothetical protein EYG68_06740 [Leucothrix mucor]|nr:hypothetical protein [Leucothrix mucor]
MNLYDYNSTESLAEMMQEFQSTAVADIQYSIEAESSETLEGLRHVLYTHHTEEALFNAVEVSDIANMGMQLFERLHFKVQRDEKYSQLIDAIILSFSYWVARNDGLIPQLDFVVNTLARTANAIHEKTALQSLYEVATYIIDAVPEDIKSSSSSLGASDPWRILVMNYCIISTRTHTPELMEKAFDVLLKYFSTEAPAFFQQGMNEMERIKYPSQVKAVIERYSQKYAAH